MLANSQSVVKRQKSTYVKLISYGAVIILAFLLPLFIQSPYKIHVFIMIAISIILASSVRMISSSGLLSLAHGGMMAIGAYTSALLVMKVGMSSWLALLAGGLAAATLAAIVGYPFVRLKGMYFSLVTVFLAEVIRLILEQWQSLTGGIAGIMSIPGPDAINIGFIHIDFSSKTELYYLILVIMIVILVIIYAIEHSRLGMTWISIGQTDSLAESVGINTSGHQVLSLTIGCFFSGIAGAFYAQYITAISPNVFGFFWSIYIVVYMTVGGQGSFLGPIIGAFILTYVPETFRSLQAYEPFVFAGIMMLVIAFLPDGLVSLPNRIVKIWKREPRHA
jgi:branched-chain amino acid transport system permease protein